MTLHPAPLAPTADALRRGRREVEAYVEDCRDRIDAVEPEIHALVEADAGGRLERAAAALRERYPDPWERPPLYGVPVGVKDIFHVDGLPTRAGSDLPPEALAGPEADVVTALREAGALVAGKTVTTEFAYMDPGPTRNPHEPDHTPGGSSQGSAAGVAAGYFPLALGTQTAGSTLRPAAFCGIVGFKPSYGRIPIGGVIPLAASVDHVGLFTQDVAGVRLASSVVCGGWEPEEPDDPVLGVPEGAYLEQASEAGRAAFEDAVEALEAADYEVRRAPMLEDVGAVNDRHNRLMAAEAALAHDEWFDAYGDRYAGATADLIREGRSVPVSELAAARAGRADLREAAAERMDEAGIDCWITPAAPGPAPEGLQSTGSSAMNRPWTHAGVPAVSIPAGRVEGLPVGLQCVGRFGADERLLAWADRLAPVVADAA